MASVKDDDDPAVGSRRNAADHRQHQRSTRCFPFAAIVGQEDLRFCLLLCAIDPSIGGVLIRGDKGTAKSTAARGLAHVLPPIRVRYNNVQKQQQLDPYNRAPATEQDDYQLCPTPFVDVPIGATEDRVIGSMDVGATLRHAAEPVFRPGLLAAANRGVLYMDEVNLVPAHLVDVLLDAAAMGVNTVQRDGIAVQHDASFVLIGTMNPEEGDVRPQLLDRFGLMVTVRAPQEATTRCRVVQQRMAFERDRKGFQQEWQVESDQLTQQILEAKERLPNVTVSDDLMLLMSTICIKLQVDSLRADITLYKTASALAAWEGRLQVVAADVKQASQWVLAHRKRKQPFESPQSPQETEDMLEELIHNHMSDRNETPPSTEQQPSDADSQQQQQQLKNEREEGDSSTRPEPTNDTTSNDASNGNDTLQTFTASKPDQIKKLQLAKRPVKDGQSHSSTAGRRKHHVNSQQPTATNNRGHFLRSVPTDQLDDVALGATLRTAALNGRLDAEAGTLMVQPDDWRRNVRQATNETVLLFIVDASGSMAARQRMEAVKGAVLALLKESYQQRDKVGVIAFRGVAAEVLLEPTRSVELAERQLQRLPTGGRTPLAHALVVTRELVGRLQQRQIAGGQQAGSMLLILLSDGKANVQLPNTESGVGHGTGDDAWTQTLQAATQLGRLEIPTLLLDTETGVVRVGRGLDLAQQLNADYLRLDDLSADGLVHTIRCNTAR